MATESLRQFGDQMSAIGDTTVVRILQSDGIDSITLKPYERSLVVTMDDTDDFTVTLPHPSTVEVGAVFIIEVDGTISTNDFVIAGAGTTAYASGDIEAAATKVLINSGMRWIVLN